MNVDYLLEGNIGESEALAYICICLSSTYGNIQTYDRADIGCGD